MGEIVALKKPGRYRAGEAICRGCRHTWEAVVEGDDECLECPECMTMKGVLRWPYGPADDQFLYVCDCGCQDYFIMKRSQSEVAAVFCRNCGNEATGWFE